MCHPTSSWGVRSQAGSDGRQNPPCESEKEWAAEKDDSKSLLPQRSDDDMQGSPSKKKPHPHRVQQRTTANSKRRAALLAIIAAPAGGAIFAAVFLAFSSSDAPHTTNKHAKSIPSYVLNYTGPTVVWENRTSFPCHPGESNWGAKSTQNIPTTKGLLYTKPIKSASSTLSGVAIQTARNVAQRLSSSSNNNNFIATEQCLVRFNHDQSRTSAHTFQYANRSRTESYLWTFIREPTERSISHFFFRRVSREKVEPHDGEFRKFLVTGHRRNYYLGEMMDPDVMSGGGGGGNGTQSEATITSSVERILELYDFIGIVERMHESLIVLKLLLGLEYQDILYLSAKGSGGYDDGAWNGTCIYIVPSFVSSGMKEWLDSDKWQHRIAGDNALYAAVYASLDRTIDRLGRDLVEEQVLEFERRLDIVREKCLNRTVFPCSEEGIRVPDKQTSCLWRDSGCGYDCYNNLAFD